MGIWAGKFGCGALALLGAGGLAAASAQGEVRFELREGALGAAHVYEGGWEHFVGGGVAILDCNGDARPDLFAAGGAAPAALFVNRSETGGAPSFLRAPLPEGLPLSGVTGAYPIDIDSDGRLDLALLRVAGNALLRGEGDCQFADASAAWGFASPDRWSTAFSATWEPGQDWPTLAIGNYVDRGDPEGPFEACDVNELWRPEGAGYGAPVELTPGYCALSMLFSDWSGAGRADLRLSNDRHYYVRGGYEQMWRMEPLGELTEAEGWARLSLWGMGIASHDITGEGLPDVMLTSMGDQVMMLNEGDGFAIAPYEVGSFATTPYTGGDGRPSTGWHAEFGDVDNDGRADLFIAKGNVDQMPGMAMDDPNNLLMQGPDGRFSEAGDAAGIASLARGRGAGLADFNGDGRLDIVVVNRRAPMEIYENVGANTGHWASVELRQMGANTRAIGAWVELRAGGIFTRREVTIGGGHAGGQAGPLHFGMGAERAGEFRVIWPDGEKTDWIAIAAGSRVIATR